MRFSNVLSIVAAVLIAVSATAQDTSRPVIPIPQQPFAQPVSEFIGTPAIPQIVPARPVPQDPLLAPNGRSGLHLDAYQSDTYPTAGPLGHSPKVSSTFLAALCGSVTFDKQGRIITVCGTSNRITAYLLDPLSIATLATFDLPPSGSTGGFGAGGYFFLDNLDRVVISTRTGDIWRLKEVNTEAGTQFAKDHTCANSLPIIPADQAILSALPDAHGLI